MIRHIRIPPDLLQLRQHPHRHKHPRQNPRRQKRPTLQIRLPPSLPQIRIHSDSTQPTPNPHATPSALAPFIDNQSEQKVFDALTKPLEISLYLLDKTWGGSVAEAIIGKAVVASALFAAFRFFKKLQTTRYSS